MHRTPPTVWQRTGTFHTSTVGQCTGTFHDVQGDAVGVLLVLEKMVSGESLVLNLLLVQVVMNI